MLQTSTALALGFLHGLGADHLMAIAALSVGTSVPGAAAGAAQTFRVALRFAIGHALVLAAGAAAALAIGWTIPVIVERAGEIAGGCLLIALGVFGLWVAVTRRVYAHTHPHGNPPHVHWHLHLGRPERHPSPARHSPMAGIIGAVFAISGLRALTLLGPLGGPGGTGSLVTLLGLVLIFALGIVLAMSLFGIVLSRAFGSTRPAGQAGHVAAVVTAVASMALGLYWILVT